MTTTGTGRAGFKSFPSCKMNKKATTVMMKPNSTILDVETARDQFKAGNDNTYDARFSLDQIRTQLSPDRWRTEMNFAESLHDRLVKLMLGCKGSIEITQQTARSLSELDCDHVIAVKLLVEEFGAASTAGVGGMAEIQAALIEWLRRNGFVPFDELCAS
jgi:hypothetical protein